MLAEQLQELAKHAAGPWPQPGASAAGTSSAEGGEGEEGEGDAAAREKEARALRRRRGACFAARRRRAPRLPRCVAGGTSPSRTCSEPSRRSRTPMTSGKLLCFPFLHGGCVCVRMCVCACACVRVRIRARAPAPPHPPKREGHTRPSPVPCPRLFCLDLSNCPNWSAASAGCARRSS
jgi:hypothetical protein